MANLTRLQEALLQEAVSVEALKFGEFTLKSGRQSPYFFNAGAFQTGQSLTVLAQTYAEKILQLREKTNIEALFGPAYKGIPLVASVATVLHLQHGWSLPYAFNRKEAKTHGEGGMLVGANLKGKKVLILDDVLTAGTAIRASLEILNEAEALPVGVVVTLDRQEILDNGFTALSQLNHQYGLITEALLNLDDLFTYIADNPILSLYQESLLAYRLKYGLQN